MKPIEFVATSLADLREFPLVIRRQCGYQLDRVQRGLEPSDWKPMPSVGLGVREIRVRDESGAYRVIYVAKLGDRVFVLHCFQKKTQKTRPADIELAAKRLAQAVARIKNGEC
ncbi:type II toxin-antitoxin system RelE/ParE family toxin [Nocardia cyriacigeorgica]|uniref:Type II toxin-antitoxin system RelE/ParE family toxin n=1 Tax=Nocardia cyriacigeorgica TaxID=135487 RepID=A0A6P1CS55_9NOCA|nr:type II toxin-antitoxin system RelE/ParE family toxin [Nocardia cyriacigeorgica]NEW35381.1 type II toxin-antitoxin system RelE/ParE family toxin [Nocardia cyriacigeorgica]